MFNFTVKEHSQPLNNMGLNCLGPLKCHVRHERALQN